MCILVCLSGLTVKTPRGQKSPLSAIIKLFNLGKSDFKYEL